MTKGSMMSAGLVVLCALTFWWGCTFGAAGALGIIPAMIAYNISAMFLIGACVVAKLDWLRDVGRAGKG